MDDFESLILGWLRPLDPLLTRARIGYDPFHYVILPNTLLAGEAALKGDTFTFADTFPFADLFHDARNTDEAIRAAE